MGTVTKTIRLDEDFLALIDDYTSLVKELFGVAPTVNNILTGCIINGFDSSLVPLKIIQNATITEEQFKSKVTEEYKNRCAELVRKYDQYSCEFNHEKGILSAECE